MIESYKAKYFIIQELVPKSVYEDRGEKAWQLIDIRLIENIDSLRHQLGVALTINNWNAGGSRDESGLRIAGQRYYKQYSQHSFGRAVDIICSIKAETIRQSIRDKDIILPHPATFELDVNWLHMDVRNSKDHVYFFHP